MNSVMNQDNSTDAKTRKLKPAFNELAHFLLSNNIKYDESLELLKSAFIYSAKTMSEKNLNKSAISLKTGIDRRQIHLKQSVSELGEHQPRKKPDPITLILGELRRYTERENSDVIQKNGDGDSMIGFCNIYKGRLTAPTLIKELKELGCIENISKNEYRILSTNIRLQQSDERKFNYASNQIFKLINTLRTNIEDPENSVVEWNVESTRINKKNKKQLSKDVEKVRNYLRSHILNSVDAYESNVKEGTYEPISLNFFINSQ